MVKNLGMSLLYFFLSILIGTIFITLLGYYSIIDESIISKIKFILPLVTIFISSFILGSKSSKLGYVEGLKLGLIIVLLFLIVTIIRKEFALKTIIYYLVILLSSTLGAMIGINKKKN